MRWRATGVVGSGRVAITHDFADGTGEPLVVVYPRASLSDDGRADAALVARVIVRALSALTQCEGCGQLLDAGEACCPVSLDVLDQAGLR